MAGFMLTSSKIPTTAQNAKDILAQGQGPRATSSGVLTLAETPSSATKITSASSVPAKTTGNNAWATGLDDRGSTDYSVLLSKAMGAGASADEVQSILDRRTQKALGTAGLSQYAFDDTYKLAKDYISEKSKPQYQEWDASPYTAAQEAQDAYLKAQLQKTVAGLEAQKGSVNDSAEEAARQAYISYMQSRNALPQALAASGYAGGLADSQRLALDTALQANQHDILKSRDTALNDIDTAVNNARLETSVQGAQAQAELARDAIAAYQNYINSQNAYANQDFWAKYGYDFQAAQDAISREHQTDTTLAQQQWQAQEAQKDRDWQTGQNQTSTGKNMAYETAWKMLSGGVIPSAELLAEAGISQADAEAYAAYIKSQMNKTGQSTQRQQVYYVGNPGDDGLIDPYGTGKGDTGDPRGTYPSVTQTQIEPAAYSGLYNQVNNLFRSNSGEAAKAILEQNWERLSQQQREELKQLFMRYGYELTEG